MEQEYLQIVEKDKVAGKDFNKNAYEHMKLSKYHFQYLRMQEKMYKYELSKSDEFSYENVPKQDDIEPIAEAKPEPLNNEQKEKDRNQKSMDRRVEALRKYESQK